MNAQHDRSNLHQSIDQQSLNLSSYVETLNADTRSYLYESPWTCQALFRALEPLAQQYVTRLLYTELSVPEVYTQHWVQADSTAQRAHAVAVGTLKRLSLFQSTKDGDHHPAYVLHKTFKARLRAALSGGGQRRQQLDSRVLQDMPTVDEIATYARNQWEGVLLFLLEPKQAPPSLPVGLKSEPLDIQRLALSARLIAEAPKSGQSRALTGEGFKFLLLDTYSQMWLLLREYINAAEQTSGRDLSSAVSFLMQLGFRQVGQAYPFEGLTPLEQRIASHMAQLGLLCTFIAVYAYTSSKIQMRILEQFCFTDCQLPNLFVGTLTRESVMGALTMGMSAQGIISFLQQHAHPQVAKRAQIVPDTVQDQIRLWEAEMQRVKATVCYMYDSFESVELYEQSLAFARQRGVLMWVNPKPDSRSYAVTKEGHAAVRDHIKALKAQMGLM